MDQVSAPSEHPKPGMCLPSVAEATLALTTVSHVSIYTCLVIHTDRHAHIHIRTQISFHVNQVSREIQVYIVYRSDQVAMLSQNVIQRTEAGTIIF